MGSVRPVTGSGTVLTGSVRPVTGFVAVVPRSVTGLSGRVAVVTGSLTVATGPVTIVTGSLTVVTGSVAVVTGWVKGVTWSVRVVSGLVNNWSAIMYYDGVFYESRKYRNLEIEDRVGGGEDTSRLERLTCSVHGDDRHLGCRAPDREARRRLRRLLLGAGARIGVSRWAVGDDLLDERILHLEQGERRQFPGRRAEAPVGVHQRGSSHPSRRRGRWIACKRACLRRCDSRG